jgi:hypothetical protein
MPCPVAKVPCALTGSFRVSPGIKAEMNGELIISILKVKL